ncbi:hypothetical protein EOL72_00590 [Candidatus Falkowbacteria bacterium]|jgi:hypothetical protein|nr:hypothetical protein [Candidatus Falkowbacteria bacterium]
MSKGKRKISDDQIHDYDDPINMTPKNLKLGFWVARNKRRLYRALVIFLGLIAFGTVAYAVYGVIEYNTIGREREKITLYSSGGVDISDYREQNRPEDLRISTPRSLAGGSETDLTVRISNPNEKQYAYFDFCFINSENEACGSDFILPQDQKDLALLNSTLGTGGEIRFVIKRILWQKLKAYEVPDWTVFKEQRLNFEVDDAQFSTYTNEVAYLEFSVSNNTPFSYFSVPFDIFIRQGDKVMAINRYVVYDFLSRSTRSVRLLWPEGEARGGNIEIIPNLNILDDSIYRPYSAPEN